MKINPKRQIFRPEQMRILKISQKIDQKRITIQKRKRNHDDSSKKVEEKGEKSTSLFLKFAKGLITMYKNVGTKENPNVFFIKILATNRVIVCTSNNIKQFFVKNMRKKWKNIFSLLLNVMFHQKVMNDILLVVVAIT